jgi:hypothetical protein
MNRIVILLLFTLASSIFLSCVNTKAPQKKPWQVPVSESDLAKLPTKGPYFICDDRIIEDRWMIERFVVPLQRHAKNPLIVKENPIDGSGPMAYGSVIFDDQEQLFKLWYTVFDSSAYFSKTPFSYNICYAESKNGFDWEKPVLNLFDNRGTVDSENNAIKLGREKTSGIDVEINPYSTSAADRFVAIHNDSGGVFVSTSSDGKSFDCSFEAPAVWYHSDTNNNFIYDEIRDKWLMYVRPRAFAGEDLHHANRRRVAVKESPDLKSWTHERTVIVPEEGDPTDFYGLTVFRRGDLFFGSLQLYETEQHHISSELIWSGDGFSWQRLPLQAQKSWLAPDSDGSWDDGMVFLYEKPVILNNEMRFYYNGTDTPHTDFGASAIGLATTPLDRLIGARALPDTLGRILTRPMRVNGDLFINAEARGNMRVEVRSAVRDEPIEGWTASDCTPFTGDSLDLPVRWGEKTLQDLNGQIIRLRFSLDKATLYSFDIR